MPYPYTQNNFCYYVKFLFGFLLTLFTVSNALADTHVTGNQSGLWSKANSPYILDDGGVTVPNGQTLLIEPGVEIRSTYYYDRIWIYGTLVAQGTSTDSIRFINSSNYGLAQEGALFFATGNTNCVMDYVIMDSWGYNYYGDVAAIYIQAGSPSISHSTIRNCNSRGIYVTSTSGTPSITNVDFINNPLGIETTTTTSMPTISGINFTNTPSAIYAYASQISGITNCNNAVITIKNSSIDSNSTFAKHTGNSYYNLEGGFSVSASKTLTLQPGVKIRSTYYYDRIWIYGTLIAQGTSTDSIRFVNSSYYGLAQEGALFFAAGSNSCVMDYVVMDSWGYNYYGDIAAIYIQDGSPSITHSSIRNSNNRGIYISATSGTPIISNVDFVNNPLGIETTTTTSMPTISGINFTNTPSAIYAYASQIGGITNCNNAVITIKNSSIDSNATFAKHTGNSYYNLEGGFSVAASKTLTLQPGVKIRSTYYYDRIWIYGTLVAQGTSTDSIRFVNNSYYGLVQEGALFFAAGSNNCVMDYVVMDSWGYNYYGDIAAIYIQDGSPSITHSSIRNSNNRAIYITAGSGSPTITNNDFFNNPLGIETTTASSKPTISDINFSTGSLSIYAYASQIGGITNCNNAVITIKNTTIDSNSTFAKHTGISYYNLEGGFTLAASKTLTLQPGVEIRSATHYDRITINGTLLAQGTATDSIRFINRNGYGLAKLGSMYLSPNSANCVFDYFTMDAWGYNYHGDDAGIYIQGGSPVITRSRFSNANNAAIFTSGASTSLDISDVSFYNNPRALYINSGGISPHVSNLTIVNSNAAGIDVASGSANPFISNIDFTNTPLSIYTFASNMPRVSNLTNAVITLKNSTIDSTCRFPKFPGVGYYNLEAGFTLAANNTLTIEPGVEIRSTTHYDRIVINGTLIAQGTAADSIRFINRNGYGLTKLGSLYLGPTSTNCVFDYVSMDAWGYNYHGDDAVIYIQGGSPLFSHCSISNSNNVAIVSSTAGNPVFSDLLINNANLGFNFTNGNSRPRISQTSFIGVPISVYNYASQVSGITNCNNAIITFRNAAIDSSGMFEKHTGTSYYNLEGGFTLNTGTILTLQPGVEIRSTTHYDRITINGTLLAQGTATDSIRFINRNGYGLAKLGSLFLEAVSTNCLLDYVSMDSWGYNYHGDDAAVYIKGGSPSITHSFFRNSNNIGVYNNSPNTIFTNNTLLNNPIGFYNVSGNPVLTNCNIYNCSNYGVYNGSGNISDTVDARNSYWGTFTGPYHPTLNPAGTGNRVSDRVKFQPWIQQPFIFSFSPVVAGDGDSVTITGDKLSSVTTVSFGGVAAKSFMIVSDSVIIAIVDTGATGSVAVSSPGGASSLAGFTFCTPFLPAIAIVVSPNDTICAGTMLTFTATPSNNGYTPLVYWTKNNTKISGASTAIYSTDSLQNNDIIRCVLVSDAPCSTKDTVVSNPITIIVNQPSNSTSYDTICSGNTYTFNGTGYTTTGIYVAHLTNAAGCDSSATLELYVKATSSSVTSASICPGDSVLFNGIYYKLQGSYPIHFTNSVGCDSTSTLNLTVKPASSSTTLATICNGDSYEFNGNSYTTSGTFTVHLTNTEGCDSSANLILTVNPVVTPTVSINSSASGPVCTGSNITFTAVPANAGATPTYQWSVNGVNVATGNAFSSTTLENDDTVICTLTTTETCVTTSTAISNQIVVNIAVIPTVNVVASADSICPGMPVTLTASGALTYSWAAANGLPASTGATVTAYPTEATTYTVTGFNGCTADATISVGMHSVPVAEAGSDQTILRGSSATLTATGGVSYLWSNGETTASIVVSPTNTTSYFVTVTNPFGCTDNDTVIVNVNFSSLTINNSSYNYGDVVLNQPASFTLQITNNGTLPVAIDSALVTPPFSAGFVTQSLPAGNTLSIPVAFNPQATLIYQQNLLLKTGVGNYNINLRGRGINPAPAWTLAPVSINYGNVTVGSNSIRNFLVTNTGNVPVSLDSLLFANTAFTSTTTIPTTIGVGANKIVSVSFNPTAIASYSDILKVKSTTNGLNQLQLSLSGFGYVPGTPPQITYLPSAPYNGNVGVNPSVGQPGLYTYRITYKSPVNIAPQNGYPTVGIDKNGDGDFIDPSEGVYSMTKLDTTSDWVNGEVYTYSTNITNGNTWGYQFFGKDSLGNNATAINTAYKSGPVVTNQTLDLSIYANDISFSKQNPAVGETFTVYANVHNNTPYSASNVNIRFYTDSLYYGETTLPFIGPNGTAPVSMNFSYNTDGFYPIKVWIDSAGALAETNALNNYAIRPITVGHFSVPGAINVTATSSVQTCPSGVVISGTAFYTGLNLQGTPPALGATVSVTVRDNNGAIVSTGDTYSVTGGNWSIYFGSLNCGSLYSYTVSITDFTLTGNLGAAKSFTIPCVTCSGGGGGGGSDVYSMYTGGGSYSPCLVQNQAFNYTVPVVNNGNKTTYNDTLRVYADGLLVQTYTMDSLIAGQSVSFNTSLTLSAGNHTLSHTLIYRNPSTPVYDSVSVVVNVLTGMPDLYLANFSQSNVGFTVLNVNGIACIPAAASYMYIYDSVPASPGYVLVDSIAAPSLGSASTLSYDFSMWSRGQHFLKLKTDGRNNVAETNENNNLLYAALTIKPDFYITDITPSSSHVKQGDVINFTATVNNRSVVGGPFKVEFKVGNTVVGAKKLISSLGYNSSTIVVSDPYIVASNCPELIKVTADAEDEVDELDETNNADSLLLGVDLIGGAGCNSTGSSCNPYTVVMGSSIQAFAPITNSGRRDADTVHVRFQFESATIGFDNVPGIAAGTTKYASLTHTFSTPGLKVVEVYPDYDGQYCETNETNNIGYIYIQVLSGLPDLRILSQDISPSNLNPNPGQPITIVSSVHNIGTVKSEPTVVRFSVDGVQLGSDVAIVGIEPGQDTTVAATASYTGTSVGPKILKAWVDSAQTMAEYDISNNAATRAVIVGAAPDFARSINEALSFSTTDFHNGDVVQLCNYIRNYGGDTGTAFLKFYLVTQSGGRQLIDSVQFTLNDRDSARVCTNWTATTDSGVIVTEITGSNPPEFNVLNNSDSITFKAEPADTIKICANDSVTIYAPSGYVGYNWSTGDTTNQIRVGIGHYALVVKDAGGNYFTIRDTRVLIKTAPTGITAAGPLHLCSADSVTLSIIGSGYTQITWSNSSTTPSIVIKEAGTYSALVTDSAGCTYNLPAVVVTQSQPVLPVVSPSGTVNTCNGQSSVLTLANGPYIEVLWNTGATTTSITVNTSGKYAVSVRDSYGCQGVSDSVVVHINATPQITLSGSATICYGGSVTLTTAAADRYLWNTGDTTQSIVVTVAATYTVTAYHGNCSSTSAIATIKYRACGAPLSRKTKNITSYTARLLWRSVQCGNGYEIEYRRFGDTVAIPLATTDTIADLTGLAPLTPYQWRIRTVCGPVKSGFTTWANFTTLAGITTRPNLGNDTTVTKCQGFTINLNNVFVTASYNYVNWNTPNPQAAETGVYRLIAGNPYGRDTVMVTVANNPKPVIGNDTTVYICTGTVRSIENLYDLTSYAAVRYSTTRPDIARAGTYLIIVSSTYGCEDTAQITVLPEPPFVPVVTASGPLTFCYGDSVALTVTGDNIVQYNWSNGFTGNPLLLKSSGYYRVTVTNHHGCTKVTTFTLVTAQKPPTPVITTNPAIVSNVCPGITVTLTSSASNNLWSTGETTASINVNTAGLYTVTAIDNIGCTASNLKYVSYRRCSPPIAFSTTAIGTTTATLNWQSVPCINSYEVDYRIAGTPTYTTVVVTDTFVNLSSLSSFTKYEWRVRCVCATGTSTYSAVRNFKTAVFTRDIFVKATQSNTTNEGIFVEVFPNPTKANASVKIKGYTGKFDLTITTAEGKPVWQGTQLNSNTVLLPEITHSGVYFITFNNGKEQKVLRLLVER